MESLATVEASFAGGGLQLRRHFIFPPSLSLGWKPQQACMCLGPTYLDRARPDAYGLKRLPYPVPPPVSKDCNVP